MYWFTWVAIWVLGTAALGSIAFVLFYNRPQPLRRTDRLFQHIASSNEFTAEKAHKAFAHVSRRKWRDRDEHEETAVG